MKENAELYKKPRRAAIFWGAFVLVAGILLLVQSLTEMPDIIRDVYKFWPLMLILAGASYFINNDMVKKIIAGINGAILALVIISIVSNSIYWIAHIPNQINGVFGNSDAHEILGDKDVEIYESIQKDSIKFAALDFEMGVNDIFITGNSDNLLDVTSNYNVLYVDWSNQNDSALICIETDNNVSLKSDVNNATAITLSDSVAWDFNLETYACNLELDFAEIDMRNLTIDTKVSSVVLYCAIPKKDTTIINIECSMSSCDIYIPKDVYCLIDFDDAKFSGIDISNEGETKDIPGGYEVNAEKKESGKIIIIKAEAHFSSVNIINR